MTDYTKQAQMLAEQYARNFYGPTYSLDDDANFSIDEAARLIMQARIDKQHALRRITAQEQSQEELAQAREDVSLLPDREAEKIQREWIKDAEASARSHAEARNRNSTPRSTQDIDPSIREGVISWIKRQKMRGGLGGPKTLKN